jgi:superfamily II DNA or RNA helicase
LQAKLVIKDEVNVKFEGLDIPTKQALFKKFKYEKPGVRFTPAVKLGRWDGKVPFFQQGGSTFMNLLDQVLPMLVDRGYDFDVVDQREYNRTFEFSPASEYIFSELGKTWPKGHPAVGQPVLLRDYQVEIINRFLENPQCIQEVATGAGKTLMTASLSHYVEPYGRSIVIVPNKDLVKQTEVDYVNLGLDVGVYFGDRKEYGRTHTICTWQSLNIMMKNTLEGTGDFTIGEFIEGVVCVIVDEVHMAKADVLKVLLTEVFHRIPIRWGLTGTIPKDEFGQVTLLSSIGPVVGKLSARELQEQGVLSMCHVNIVQMIDHVEYKDYRTEFKYLVENEERVAAMARLVDKIKDSGNTLILVDRITTGKYLQAELSSLFSLLSDKPDVSFISGTTHSDDRKEEYDDVATATNKVIIATYGVAAVGINIPRIFNLVLVEPGKSFVRVIQSIGRGIRKAEDKDFVQIWDITSTCKFAKRHLTERKKFYTEANYPFDLIKQPWQ